MKKAALILLVCIYSLATVGFSIKQFYCCGKLESVSVSIVQNTNDNCGKGSDKTGCCNNKYQFFKVKDNHVAADELTSPPKYFVDLIFDAPYFTELSFTAQKSTGTYRSNGPPLHFGVPVYISNRVFRI